MYTSCVSSNHAAKDSDLDLPASESLTRELEAQYPSIHSIPYIKARIRLKHPMLE